MQIVVALLAYAAGSLWIVMNRLMVRIVRPFMDKKNDSRSVALIIFCLLISAVISLSIFALITDRGRQFIELSGLMYFIGLASALVIERKFLSHILR